MSKTVVRTSKGKTGFYELITHPTISLKIVFFGGEPDVVKNKLA